MAFPTGLPSYLGFTAGHTLLADTHAAQHNQEQADIVGLATKIGTGSSTPTGNKVLRGTGTGTSAWGQIDLTNDVTNTLPITSGGTGAASASAARTSLGVNTQAETLAVVYPIGCLYTETTGVNPAVTFGFGTWAAFGAGRVLVGNGTSDQAFAAGATGGESAHALTNAEMPIHSITISHHGDEGGSAIREFDGTGGTTTSISTPSFYRPPSTQTAGASSYQSPTVTWGSNTAHNNLQPYVVVYFWKRTA